MRQWGNSRALSHYLKEDYIIKAKVKFNQELQEVYKNRSDALKWLLVVSFGYTGFKNAPLSSPNIFEQINKWGRIALIQTKDIFEEQGFDVLHIYIDSIFVKREEPITDEIIDSLLIKVKKETGLPISLECIYKWVVFLPSKVNSRYVVPNSYFGVFQNGDIKARGIQCRRGDKPPFVKNSQIKIIEMLAEAKDLSCIRETFPQIFNFIMKQVEKIKQGQIPIEDLIITQRLSKNIEDYIMPSHVAKAGIQLKSAGVDIRAGSKIKFIYIKGNPRVLPWDLVPNSKGYQIDIEHYISLFKDAVKTVLIPFSIEEDFIENLIKLIPAKQLSFIPINERLRKFKISSSEDSNYYLY
ncbi:MAG: DNA polymerase domain-containing protein [Saprospiraceae bacterium]